MSPSGSTKRNRFGAIALQVLRWAATVLVLATLWTALALALMALYAWLCPGGLLPGNALVLALLFALAASLAIPLLLLLRLLINRLLYRERVNFAQVVQDFGSSLAQVIDLPELSHLTLTRIAGALRLDTASLYLFDPCTGTYTLYEALAGLDPASAPCFAETDRLVTALHAATEAIYRHDRQAAWPPGLGTEEAQRIDHLQAVIFLPLHTKGRLVGWINLGERPFGERYNAKDLQLLNALADRAAVAIENARLFAEHERRLTELAVLNEIGQAINSAHSLQQVLETTYREAGRLMDTTNFYIALYDPQKEEVAFPFLVEDGQRRTETPRRRGNGLTEYLLRTQQPLLIAERVEETVRSLGLEVIGRPARSWLGVPILREGQAIGVMAVQNHTTDTPYDVEDLNILSAIANQAAIAIENARLYEMTDQALSSHLQEITVLADFARTLATVSLDPAQVAEQTLSRAGATLQAQMGVLAHFDPATQEFVPLAQVHWPSTADWPQVWHTLLPDLLAASHGSLTLPGDSPAAAALLTGDTTVHLICPLIRQNALLAVLHLALPAEAAPNENRRRFLRHLADHAAIALENALLYQQQVRQRQALDRRARHLGEILDLSIAIRANMEMEQVLRLVVETVRETVGFGLAVLSVLDEEDPAHLRPVAFVGLDAATTQHLLQERLPLSLYEEMMRPEFRLGLSYLITPDQGTFWEDIRGHNGTPTALLALLDRPEWRDPCTILIPLRGTGDRLLGILSLAGPPDGHIPERTTIELLEIIANQAAVAIENSHLYQALREAYQTRGEFLTLVAHELQVPMGTLWGYAELLDQESAHVDLNTLRGFIRVLKTNITRLDAVVRDLLEVSRIEAGSFSLRRVQLDVSEVVLDSVASFRPQAERKGLRLKVEAPLGLPSVWADRDRLGQILDNLLSNACKYTPAPGTITVSAGLVQSAELGAAPRRPEQHLPVCPCILLCVQDSGIGLSRAEQKRLFTRFFRADHPVVRQEAGTGLGLYLVRLLVEAHEGQVWVESEPGRGSKFYVALPVAR